MSVNSALNAGVAGLRTNGTRLAAISDNVANASTVGYKRADAQFSSLFINGGAPGTFSAAGAEANIRTFVSNQGIVTATQSNTDLAIGGNGFFVVSNAPTLTGGQGTYSFTRAGSFVPDEDGFLRNTAGQYLQGFRLDENGDPIINPPSQDTFNDLETVDITGLTTVGSPTTAIDFAGNLPAGALQGETFETSIEYFSPLGEPRTLTLRWTSEGDPTTATATPPLPDNRWSLELLDEGVLITDPIIVDFADATSTVAPITLAGAPDSFGPDPILDPTGAPYPATPVAGNYDVRFGAGGADSGTLEITVPLATGSQTFSLSLGATDTLDGIAQFGDDYRPEPDRDGAAAGQVIDVDIDENGVMFAIFDNGLRRAAYQIPLAVVPNPDGLDTLSGNLYRTSNDSGDFRLFNPNQGPAGIISAGALEGSNVDVAEEITSIIVTQRAYSTNATVVRTADEMLEEITRLR